jgi:hypothetical protein
VSKIRVAVAPQTPPATAEQRRRPEQVLGLENSGSPAGATRWKRLRVCPREHALHQIVKLRPTGESEPLTVGWLVHLGLERFYATLQSTQAHKPDDVRAGLWAGCEQAEAAAWSVLEPIRDESGYAETYSKVESMLAGYFDQYRRQDMWRILAVEETLIYRGAFAYSARLDLVVEDIERGGMWIVEHKTAKAVTEDLLHGYQMDLQVLGQVWLMQKCVDLEQYPPLQGVHVNILTKHAVPRFERASVTPSKYHLQAFETSMRHWQTVSKTFEATGWPHTFGACTGPSRWGKRCGYFDLCHGRPEFTVDDWLQQQDPPYGFTHASSVSDAAEEDS